MNYQDYFVPYAKTIDENLEQHFEHFINSCKGISPLAVDMWTRLDSFIHGGKRIRGGLIKLGYECCNGKSNEMVIPVSCAMEITHGSLLVHDDIVDHGDVRHNQPTIHKQYEHYHKKNYHKGSPAEYGEYMAIGVGDLGFYGAISLITESKFSNNTKVRAIGELSKRIMKTVYGQALDIDLAYRSSITDKEVRQVNLLKTALYTFVGPLRLGGILANATDKEIKKFDDYGYPLGIAYQIQDDILGIFGSFEKVGKESNLDIKEGKNTLLYTHAIKKGSPAQVKRLKEIWGNLDITNSDIEDVHKIITDTGSLAHSRKVAKKLGTEAKRCIPKVAKDKKIQEVLDTLADYIIERES